MDVIAEAWNDYVTSGMHEDWAVDPTMLAEDIRTDPPSAIIATCTGNNGVGTGNPLPAQCTWVLSLRAATGGRRGRGRVYLPGIGEGDVDDSSKVSALYVSGQVADFTTFSIATAVVGWVPAVYSRTDGVVRVVASIGGDRVIDTQRRRVQRLA